jgi:hypothetical protein
MTQAPAATFKIPRESSQPGRRAARPARKAKAARLAPGRVFAGEAYVSALGDEGVCRPGLLRSGRREDWGLGLEPRVAGELVRTPRASRLSFWSKGVP